jgi:hypothetical protein
MKIMKTIIPIAVIGLFLTMASAPALAEDTHKVRVFWAEDPTNPEYHETDVSVDKLDEAKAIIEKLYNDISTITGPLDPKLETILTEFKGEIEACLGIFFPSVSALLPLVIPSALRPHGFITVGWGKAIMPFYKWEAFLRFIPLIRPIRVLVYGYTGYWQILPGISYGDKSHSHYVTARFFQGLFIDGGSLLTERYAGGPVLVLGRAVHQGAYGIR